MIFIDVIKLSVRWAYWRMCEIEAKKTRHPVYLDAFWNRWVCGQMLHYILTKE